MHGGYDFEGVYGGIPPSFLLPMRAGRSLLATHMSQIDSHRCPLPSGTTLPTQ